MERKSQEAGVLINSILNHNKFSTYGKNMEITSYILSLIRAILAYGDKHWGITKQKNLLESRQVVKKLPAEILVAVKEVASLTMSLKCLNLTKNTKPKKYIKMAKL